MLDIFAQTPPPVDAVTPWAAPVAAFFVTFGMVCTIVLQLMARADAKEKAALARGVAELASKKQDEASKKQDEGLRINRATHTLVNKETSDKLRKLAAKSRRIYELQISPENLRDLEDDERALREHLARQDEVDREYGAEAKDMGTDRQ
jgi:hypothetical protein